MFIHTCLNYIPELAREGYSTMVELGRSAMLPNWPMKFCKAGIPEQDSNQINVSLRFKSFLLC